MEKSLTLCKYKVVLHFSYLSFHLLLKYTHICFVSVREIFLDLFNICCALVVCTLAITLFFTFIFLCRVNITGISEDQDTTISEGRNLSLQDGNYASISVSMQEINPNFASFERNPFQGPIERCVYIPCSS